MFCKNVDHYLRVHAFILMDDDVPVGEFNLKFSVGFTHRVWMNEPARKTKLGKLCLGLGAVKRNCQYRQEGLGRGNRSGTGVNLERAGRRRIHIKVPFSSDFSKRLIFSYLKTTGTLPAK